MHFRLFVIIDFFVHVAGVAFLARFFAGGCDRNVIVTVPVNWPVGWLRSILQQNSLLELDPPLVISNYLIGINCAYNRTHWHIFDTNIRLPSTIPNRHIKNVIANVSTLLG